MLLKVTNVYPVFLQPKVGLDYKNIDICPIDGPISIKFGAYA